MRDGEFDWLEWAGLKESDTEKLFSEARKHNIPVFEEDSKQELFNRVLSVRTYKANKKFVIINIVLASISCLAAVITLIVAFAG